MYLPLGAMVVGCLSALIFVFILIWVAIGKARPLFRAPPLLVAVSPLVVAVITLPIAFIKREIPQTEIAQTLLAQRGVGFSTAALQNQLYLFNYSALDLFLDAGVQTDAIFNALGQETPFGDDEPLVLESLIMSNPS